MPSKNQHLQKARHDEEFVQFLDSTAVKFTDWAATGLFYAALHYVEAYFATRGTHSPDHRARDSSVYRDKRLRQIYNDYNELKNFSINARYYIIPIATDELRLNLAPRLAAIRECVLSLV